MSVTFSKSASVGKSVNGQGDTDSEYCDDLFTLYLRHEARHCAQVGLSFTRASTAVSSVRISTLEPDSGFTHGGSPNL